jgi:N-acetylmuramoyl-L-alanine amidase
VALLDNTHRSAGFAVLKAPDVPSALVELGCLSNHMEERQLQQTSYRRKLATSLLRSVNDYFDFVAKA